MQSSTPKNIILDVKKIVASSGRSEIRIKSNGGNSILIVCDPKQELNFINIIKKELPEDNFTIIDLNIILCEYVQANMSTLEESFDLLKGSIQQIFKSPPGEDTPDLFLRIIDSISNSFKVDKIPVLINSGAIYGSGIENIHIIENEVVMNSSSPIIILYPATHDGDKLMFLGNRPASKYRCMIIE